MNLPLFKEPEFILKKKIEEKKTLSYQLFSFLFKDSSEGFFLEFKNSFFDYQFWIIFDGNRIPITNKKILKIIKNIDSFKMESENFSKSFYVFFSEKDLIFIKNQNSYRLKLLKKSGKKNTLKFKDKYELTSIIHEGNEISFFPQLNKENTYKSVKYTHNELKLTIYFLMVFKELKRMKKDPNSSFVYLSKNDSYNILNKLFSSNFKFSYKWKGLFLNFFLDISKHLEKILDCDLLIKNLSFEDFDFFKEFKLSEEMNNILIKNQKRIKQQEFSFFLMFFLFFIIFSFYFLFFFFEKYPTIFKNIFIYTFHKFFRIIVFFFFFSFLIKIFYYCVKYIFNTLYNNVFYERKELIIQKQNTVHNFFF